jgi:CHASE3 domain sensor protein
MEKAIVEKEKNLKSCLNKEFENISNQMENLFQSKLQTMNKKFILAERNLKNKVKIIESKQKETKVQ